MANRSQQLSSIEIVFEYQFHLKMFYPPELFLLRPKKSCYPRTPNLKNPNTNRTRPMLWTRELVFLSSKTGQRDMAEIWGESGAHGGCTLQTAGQEWGLWGPRPPTTPSRAGSGQHSLSVMRQPQHLSRPDVVSYVGPMLLGPHPTLCRSMLQGPSCLRSSDHPASSSFPNQQEEGRRAGAPGNLAQTTTPQRCQRGQ